LVEEAGQLWRRAGEALALIFGSSPGVDVRLTRHSWMVCTGESLPDFNCGIIGAHLDATQTLQEFAGAFRARKAPFLICLTPKVASELDSIAAELGLKYKGTLPLMSLMLDGPIEPCAGDFTVERVASEAQLEEFNEVGAKSFSFPPDVVKRVIAPHQLEVVGFDTFILRHQGVAASVMATTWHDRTVGIWSMGTPPEFRRKGLATALVNHVVGFHQGKGVSQFFLLASAMGRPMYEKLGFQVASNGHIWQG
jgi:GNAT superfamily N-acetyltransferase